MDNKKIQAVLFDLGETLINYGPIKTTSAIFEAGKRSYEYLKKMNQPVGKFASYITGNLLNIRVRAILAELFGHDFDSLEELKKYEEEILEKLDIDSLEHLFLNVGEAKISFRELRHTITGCLPEDLEIQKPSGRGLNKISLATLDPAIIKFSSCCKPVPTEKGLIGILNEWGISVHQKTCERFRALKVRREDVVELQWLLKETIITKPQHLFVEEATRNRILMMLAVAPDKMKVADILVLSRIDIKKPAWEINFEIANLQGLKSILAHFNKSRLPYEFVIEQ